MFRLIDDQEFMTFFDDSSLELEHILFNFRRFQKIDSPESSCISWLPYPSAEGAVKQIEASKVLGRKRGTTVKSLLSENILEGYDTWLPEEYFQYRATM